MCFCIYKPCSDGVKDGGVWLDNITDCSVVEATGTGTGKLKWGFVRGCSKGKCRGDRDWLWLIASCCSVCTFAKLGKFARDVVLAGYIVTPLGGGVNFGARVKKGFCGYKCGWKIGGL